MAAPTLDQPFIEPPPQAVAHTDWVRAELGLDGAKDVDEATRAKLDALTARPSSTQKIF